VLLNPTELFKIMNRDPNWQFFKPNLFGFIEFKHAN